MSIPTSITSSQETIADYTITEPSKSNDCQSELSFDFDNSADECQRTPVKLANSTQSKVTDIEDWLAPTSYLVCEEDQSKIDQEVSCQILEKSVHE